jgi:hypothetical protein
MSDYATGFERLFSLEWHGSARQYSDGFRWDFPSSDLNESARSLFRRLDSIFETLHHPNHAFLTSIELDAEAGRFPDLLAQYFHELTDAESRTFFVAPIRHLAGEGYPVGRLTFAAEPDDLARVLRQDGGIRWGAALRVWGLQVPHEYVEEVVGLSPFDVVHRPMLARRSRAAWIAADDLHALALWVSSTVSASERERVAQLGP